MVQQGLAVTVLAGLEGLDAEGAADIAYLPVPAGDEVAHGILCGVYVVDEHAVEGLTLTPAVEQYYRALAVHEGVKVLLQHLGCEEDDAAVGVRGQLADLLEIIRSGVVQTYIYCGKAVFARGLLHALDDRGVEGTVVDYPAVAAELDEFYALEALGAGEIAQLTRDLKDALRRVLVDAALHVQRIGDCGRRKPSDLAYPFYAWLVAGLHKLT